MIQNRYLFGAMFQLLFLLAAIGCQSQQLSSSSQGEAKQDNSTGGQAVTDGEVADFRTELARIEEKTTKICRAFAEGSPEDAHHALHDVGHSLERLADLAAKEGLSSEQLSAINTAVETLFESFGKLDNTLHSDEEVDVKEVENKLTLAITELKGVLQ